MKGDAFASISVLDVTGWRLSRFTFPPPRIGMRVQLSSRLLTSLTLGCGHEALAGAMWLPSKDGFSQAHYDQGHFAGEKT
jgi:hypothetical protein